MGSNCKFTCNSGYELRGSNTSVCNKNGNDAKWSHKEPVCVKKLGDLLISTLNFLFNRYVSSIKLLWYDYKET